MEKLFCDICHGEISKGDCYGRVVFEYRWTPGPRREYRNRGKQEQFEEQFDLCKRCYEDIVDHMTSNANRGVYKWNAPETNKEN